MKKRTFYDTLQVSNTASESVIRAAYRALSQRHHPDKNPGKEEAAHRNMQLLNEAYEVLSDRARRQSYDRVIAALESVDTIDAARDLEEAARARAAKSAKARSEAARAAQAAMTARMEQEQSAAAKFNQGFPKRSFSETGAGPSAYRDKAASSADGVNATHRTPFGRGIFMGAIFLIFGFAVLYYTNLLIERRNSNSNEPVAATAEQRKPSKYADCNGTADIYKCEEFHAALEASLKARVQAQIDGSLAKAKKDQELASRRNAAVSVPAPTMLPQPSPPSVRATLVSQPLPPRYLNPDCPSAVTLKITSTNYSGLIQIELRQGFRPGSLLLETFNVNTTGTVLARNVCGGNYFFSFGTPDSETVNVTRNFTVENGIDGYSNPEITVFYTRSSQPDAQKVASTPRSSL